MIVMLCFVFILNLVTDYYFESLIKLLAFNYAHIWMGFNESKVMIFVNGLVSF